MRRRTVVVLIVVAVVIVGVLGTLTRGSGNGTAAVTYLTAPVERTDVVAQAVADGTVRSVATYGLAFGAATEPIPAGSAATGGSGAATTWIARKVSVAVGQAVKKNETLATADTSDADRQVAIAEADLHAAEAQFEDAVGDGPIESARAAVRRARGQVADAKLTRARATLRAPEAGTIVAVAIQAGYAAPAGFAIQLQSSRLEVVGEFAEADLPALAPGQPAKVTINADGSVLDGTVSRIVPAASATATRSVVTYQAVVELAAAGGIVPGMSAEIAVTTSTVADVLAVPATAIDGTKGAYTVRVLDGAGSASVRPVTIGLATGSLVQILTGLTEGEKVVIGTTADRAVSAVPTPAGGGGFNGGATPTPTPKP